MITSLRLNDFKNFADETLDVGPFTVIVGANASGKSNIRDAFRFLHGVGRGYSLAEIVGGKREAGWKPIRGATKELVRFRTSGTTSDVPQFSLNVEMVAPTTWQSLLGTEYKARYRIDVRPENSDGATLTVADEALWIDSTEIYTGAILEDQYIVLDRSRPVLTQLPPTFKDVANVAAQHTGTHASYIRSHPALGSERVADVVRQLHWMRFFDFNPDRMREPAFPGQTTLGNSGEYLPTVLREICADPKRMSVLASWLRGLTPMDVENFEFPEDPSGRIYLVICEKNGAKVSASSLSGGTLRFLAMLAALLGDNPPYVYFFEEIEKGLHTSRLHLLIELIERVTSDGTKQVVATTHSPELLSLVGDSTFESTSVVCRLEDANEAVIRPVAELPKARELRKTQGLGRLLSGRWMETALAFTEGNGNDAEHPE